VVIVARVLPVKAMLVGHLIQALPVVGVALALLVVEVIG
jgi:hypothetical protein